MKININEIVKLNESKGFHFFEPSSMRFFSSRKPTEAYLNESENKAYFVTSEQFVSSLNEKSERKYSVRVCNMETGDIHTIGEFNKLNRNEAVKEAKELSLKLLVA